MDKASAPVTDEVETRAFVSRETTKHRDGRSQVVDDIVVVEEPLEVRLDDAPLAVIMRTPGADFELAAGLLLGEGLIRGPDDVAGVSWCREPGETGPTNVVSVASREGRGAELVAGRQRAILTSSSCGLCGRVTLDEIEKEAPPLRSVHRPDIALLTSAMEQLRTRQTWFDHTGANHGAAVLVKGEIAATFEDIGRHNAVDKCVGKLLLSESLPLSGALLVVSGRVSFEIVQKALMASISAVAGVGGVSSLAVRLASESGMFLAGFVRNGGANIYA